MEKNKMGEMPMAKLVFNMSLPLMISLLVQSLYNIVDSIFVAKLSEEALTAVSLAYPVQLLMIAVAVGTGVGVSALLSQSIGAGKTKETTNIANTGVFLCIVGTLVFMLAGLFAVDWFVGLFTSDAAIAQQTQSYLWICMIFCAGTFFGTMFQRFMQSTGDTVGSMITLVAGAVTNLILDPVFIFTLNMGVQGAAIATVIGQWVCAVLAIVLNTRNNPQVQVQMRRYKVDGKTIRRIYQVGIPTIVTQALGSVMLSAVNAILILFSPTAVAFFGVYYKLQNFLFMTIAGMGQASIPIVGYSYGAKKYSRITEMLKVMIPSGVIFSVVVSILFAVFPWQLLMLFSAGEEMLAIGVPALRIICPTFALTSVTMLLGYSMSGLGNGIINMVGTALRQVVLLIPGIWVLSSMFGVEYAWYAFWVAEIAAVIFAVFGSLRVLKQKGIIHSIPKAQAKNLSCR